MVENRKEKTIEGGEKGNKRQSYKRRAGKESPGGDEIERREGGGSGKDGRRM